MRPETSEGYPSGQRGQTVNLLAYAFGGSNPPPSTMGDQQAGIEDLELGYGREISMQNRKGALRFGQPSVRTTIGASPV